MTNDKASFPDAFLWGAASSGHQTEGGNVNASIWPLEHTQPSFFAEPSGDACDSYHRYCEDITLLADVGLRAYRFGIEWSRIEPEPGLRSIAAVDHYRRMAEACLARDVTPAITLNHFTVPRWFNWYANDAVERYVDYATTTVSQLADLCDTWFTFNEPNLGEMFSAAGTIPIGVMDRPDGVLIGVVGDALERLVEAHRQASAAIRSIGSGHEVGWTLAMPFHEPVPGGEERVADIIARSQTIFLEVSRDDDFVGVQNYARERFGTDGLVEPPADSPRMHNGWEIFPASLARVCERAAATARVPVLVTEHGVDTTEDHLRIDTLRSSLRKLGETIAGGVDVRGYFCWSLLDSWEWTYGFAEQFGLIEVDRRSLARRPKPSLAWLGRVAAANSV